MGKISAVVPSASNGLLSQEIVLDNDSWTLQQYFDEMVNNVLK